MTRDATAADADVLWAMLGEAAAWAPDAPTPPRAALEADPALARYVAGWPREGDAGVIAEVDEHDRRRAVGAAWYRRFDADDAGYGFVAADVPELSIGVDAAHRGAGTGRRLLTELVEHARRNGVERLSLSVEDANPARRLYERVGFVAVGRVGGATTMALALG